LSTLLAIPAAAPRAQHAGHGAEAVEQDSRDNHGDHAAADEGPEANATQDLYLDPVPPAPPAAALSGPEHAADTIFDAEDMAAAREQLRIEHGAFRTQMVLADRIEARAGDGDESFVWDL